MSKPSTTDWRPWRMPDKGNLCQLCRQPIGCGKMCVGRRDVDNSGRNAADPQYRHERCHSTNGKHAAKKRGPNPAALAKLYWAVKSAHEVLVRHHNGLHPELIAQLVDATSAAERLPRIPAPQRPQKGQRINTKAQRIRAALEMADGDIPDGAYVQLAADIAGVDTDEVFDELAQGDGA